MQLKPLQLSIAKIETKIIIVEQAEDVTTISVNCFLFSSVMDDSSEDDRLVLHTML